MLKSFPVSLRHPRSVNALQRLARLRAERDLAWRPLVDSHHSSAELTFGSGCQSGGSGRMPCLVW